MIITRNIGMNGHGQFFVITRFPDGSAHQCGPFATGEQAAAELARREQVVIGMTDATWGITTDVDGDWFAIDTGARIP